MFKDWVVPEKTGYDVRFEPIDDYTAKLVDQLPISEGEKLLFRSHISLVSTCLYFVLLPIPSKYTNTNTNTLRFLPNTQIQIQIHFLFFSSLKIHTISLILFLPGEVQTHAGARI
jgi:hypothetical protein